MVVQRGGPYLPACGVRSRMSLVGALADCCTAGSARAQPTPSGRQPRIRLLTSRRDRQCIHGGLLDDGQLLRIALNGLGCGGWRVGTARVKVQPDGGQDGVDRGATAATGHRSLPPCPGWGHRYGAAGAGRLKDRTRNAPNVLRWLLPAGAHAPHFCLQELSNQLPGRA